jgi:hypothetical protein
MNTANKLSKKTRGEVRQLNAAERSRRQYDSPTFTVSLETGEFMKCILLLGDVCNQMRNALAERYGEFQADSILLDEFYGTYLELQNIITRHMSDSIVENILSGE